MLFAVEVEREPSVVLLGEAVLALVERYASPNGAAVILEDLQWAGAETLAVVEYLSDKLDATSVALLVSVRTGESSGAERLAYSVDARRGASVVTLPRLNAPSPTSSVPRRTSRRGSGSMGAICYAARCPAPPPWAAPARAHRRSWKRWPWRAVCTLGSEVPAPLRVVLVNLEDTRNTMDKRIAATMRHYGLTPADIGDRLIVKAKGEIKIKVAKQLRSGDVARNKPIIRRWPG